jgi:DNA helicase HerA-like ATPase
MTAPAGAAPVRAILGQRGFGKSTLARALVADRTRLLVFDPMHEHDALPLGWRDFELYTEALDRGGYARGFRIGLIDTIEHEEDFCAWAWEIAGRCGGLTVLADEADMLAVPGQETEIFRRLVAQGRHYAIEFLACSRRPAELSRYLTGQADELYIFRCQEPRDLAYIRSFCGREAAEQIQELQPFHYLAWGNNAWTLHSCPAPAAR